MKKKSYLVTGVLICLIMVLGMPIQSKAMCFDWGELLSSSYCATPVCYTGNRTSFRERRYERMCSDGVFGFKKEYKVEKVEEGCCPYN